MSNMAALRVAMNALLNTSARGWATFGVFMGSLVVLYALTYERSKTNAPVVGSTRLGGYWFSFQSLVHRNRFLQEGYTKYKNGAFQMPGVRSWVVYVQGEALEDVAKAEESLSHEEELNFSNELPFVLPSPSKYGAPSWHVPVLRSHLTPDLSGLFPDMLEETKFAWNKVLNLPEGKEDEWKEVNAHETIERTVCRAIIRMFVGTALSRKGNYLTLSREIKDTLTGAGTMISIFPSAIKAFVGEWLSPASDAVAKFMPYTNALVRVRGELKEKYGPEQWDTYKPNDMLQWFLDTPDGPGPDATKMNDVLTSINMAAIHPTADTLTHALYQVAAHPEYAQELLDEVNSVTREKRWTREAVEGMHKLDSFVKESMRLNPTSVASVARRALKPLTLSDGTQLRKGAHVYANVWGTQHDPSLWPEADTFDPWRFVKAEKEGGGECTTPSKKFLAWGYGEHVCPGRFFAVQLIKLQLAHIVTSYDVKLKDGDSLPEPTFWGNACLPDPKAVVCFRRRQPAEKAP